MSGRYWTGAHTKHRIRFHVVWIPKRRKAVLRGKIARRVRELMYKACGINKWWIQEMSVNEDHVHLLIQIKARESIASVVHRLKGGSSRVLRKENPEMEEFVWSDSFWCDGYFAETVGVVNEEVIERYIKKQESSMPDVGRSPGL